MSTRVRLFFGIFLLTAAATTSFAQTPTRAVGVPVSAQEPSPSPTDPIANEVGLLRKSVQSLNTTLRDISDKLFGPDGKGAQGQTEQAKILANLDLLSHVEQRAELLRKQLFDLTEREGALKGRLVQIDEDMRPESIERSLTTVGTTRTSELRDARRRVLDNERRTVDGLLNQVTQSRVRMEEDVRQADLMVYNLRQRLLPLIDMQIEKIRPNP